MHLQRQLDPPEVRGHVYEQPRVLARLLQQPRLHAQHDLQRQVHLDLARQSDRSAHRQLDSNDSVVWMRLDLAIRRAEQILGSGAARSAEQLCQCTLTLHDDVRMKQEYQFKNNVNWQDGRLGGHPLNESKSGV